LKLISSSAAKTDKQDALVLAKLLAANLVPEVWVPPVHVREARRLTQHRSQLLTQQSSVKNKLHAILHHHNLQAPSGNPFAKMNEGWWHNLSHRIPHRIVYSTIQFNGKIFSSHGSSHSLQFSFLKRETILVAFLN
jgi:hypothetical protein